MLPSLQGTANLFFASINAATLSAPAIDRSWGADRGSPAIHPVAGDQLFDFDSGKTGAQGGASTDHPNVTVGPLFLSPDGSRLAVQAYAGALPAVWLIDLSDHNRPVMMSLTEASVGRFLGWHPDSRHALYAALDLYVSDPGLWLVDVTDGTHRRLAIPELVAPEGLTAAAFSPDGSTLAYALTGGLGTGSTVWLMKNQDPRQRVWTDHKTVAASLTFSPDGKYLALTNLLDSPVPFAKAGLWAIDTASGKSTFLTLADGGHGQQPVWSRDSAELYLVKRDNLDDDKADYDASALVSSIHAVRVADRAERELAPSSGARQVDLSLTPNGDLAFASNRGSISEIWAVGAGGALRQVTSDGVPKRFPLFLAAQREPR